MATELVTDLAARLQKMNGVMQIKFSGGSWYVKVKIRRQPTQWIGSGAKLATVLEHFLSTTRDP